MKKVVSVTEVSGEGLEAFLGEKVLLMCTNYFYTGVLTGVNEEYVLLESPAIVYETGEWSAKSYKDAQPLGIDKWYVIKSAIESFGAAK